MFQGTRSATGKMAEFKKGAFTVAAKEGAAVVPITLDGTGRLMRNGAFRVGGVCVVAYTFWHGRARGVAVPGEGDHHGAPADPRRRRRRHVRRRASRRGVRAGAQVPRAEGRRSRQGIERLLGYARVGVIAMRAVAWQ